MAGSLSMADWTVEISEAKVNSPPEECRNPEHDNMFFFKDLKITDLPENHRTKKKLNKIRSMGERVVKLDVKKIEKGPGSLEKTSTHIIVVASKTLIKTIEDIKNCTFEIQLCNGVKTFHGDKKLDREIGDSVSFTFLPELDKDEFDKCTSKKVTLKVLKPISGTGIAGKYKDEFTIKTNSHVVKTDDDVRDCTVYFHYDSSEQDAVVCQGKELQWTCPYRDVTLFSFSPVPEFLKELDIVNFGTLFPTVEVLYDDGHTDTACIYSYEDKNDALLYGINININRSDIRDIKLTFADDTPSYPCSLYLLFKPIPKNIESLTHTNNGSFKITLHDKDVSGTYVNIENTHCIKLNEPITIEESKQMVLRFPDNFISYGTGLYFENRDYQDFFTEESKLHSSLERIYFFHLKPRTKEMDLYLDSLKQMEADKSNTEEFCVIGHPHGKEKRVSFGNHLAYFIQDISDVGGEYMPCRMYTCPTCKGSSGAPVIMLASLDAKKTFGTTHFMKLNKENIPINGKNIYSPTCNLNGAWSPAHIKK